MRDLVAAWRPALLDAVTDVVGCDPFARLEQGTSYLQPAIYCTGLASLASVTRDAGPDRALYAGHSLGEITALTAAGSMREEDGLRLVAARGRLMQRAAEQGPEGGMLALGTGAAEAAELADSDGLTVANDNSPDQVVLSGPADAIERVRAKAKERGLRAMRLPIRGAFHSPALAAIAPEFRAVLDEIEIRPPRQPVYSGVTAREFDDVRARLVESLTCGVRWREVLLALRARGADTFIEVAPGKVLTGLVRRTLGEEVVARPVRDREAAVA